MRLERQPGREIGRIGKASHIGIAVIIDRNGLSRIDGRAAEITGVDDVGAAGVQLDHEGIGDAGELCLPACGQRKIGGVGGARDVDVAGRVECDAHVVERVLGTATAEIGRELHDRIDDQRMALVIVPKREARTPTVVDRPPTRDGLSLAIDVLIHERRGKRDFGVAAREDQLTGVAEVHGVSTGERQHQRRRIGAGGDDEIELELLLGAVVDKIDAGVDIFVLDTRIGRHVGAPRGLIVATQVVDAPRRGAGTGDTRGLLRTNQGHTQQRWRACGGAGLEVMRRLASGHAIASVACGPAFRVQTEHRFRRGQKQLVAASTREEQHVWIGLSEILFE